MSFSSLALKAGLYDLRSPDFRHRLVGTLNRRDRRRRMMAHPDPRHMAHRVR